MSDEQTERVQRHLIDHLRADRDRIETEFSATIRSLQSSLDQAWRQRDVAYARRDKLRADHEAATRGWANALDELEAFKKAISRAVIEADPKPLPELNNETPPSKTPPIVRLQTAAGKRPTTIVELSIEQVPADEIRKGSIPGWRINWRHWDGEHWLSYCIVEPTLDEACAMAADMIDSTP